MKDKVSIKTHKDYLGDLIGGSLMIRESQLIADFLLRKPSQQQWLEAIAEHNILQKRSIASAKRNAATIRKRIGNMPDDFLTHLANGSSDLSTQLMFAATLINSTLLADFMRHVVADARRMFRQTLDLSDWESFWQDRIRLFPELGQMSAASTYKIAQVAFKVIADGGFIESTRGKELQNVYLLPEVRELLLSMERQDIISAMELT